ncbi:hypothetical protein [Nocardioides yefusunii]|uniref:Minor tail protein n=1 Tax=Nocardioides yefusunii TaxID=2500546 RepID=A0ABW1QVU5_9ACTN|nr:hypothetical protein [Nocardioides yefusunii]
MIDPDSVAVLLGYNASAHPNYCLNPNGAVGGVGWRTLIPGSRIQSVDASSEGAPEALAYVSSAAGAQVWQSVEFPVDGAAGHRPYAYFTAVFTSADLACTFTYTDAAGTWIGTSSTHVVPAGTTRTRFAILPAAPAPAGARTCVLSMSFTASGAGTSHVLTDFKLTSAATAPGDATVGSLTWNDISDWCEDITATLAGLSVGTLTVRAHDQWAVLAARPGHQIRVEVGGQRLWTGVVSRVVSESRKAKRAGVDLKPIVTITATDAVTQLAGTPAPRGVTSFVNLPASLDRGTTPWVVQGVSDSVAVAATLSTPGASALDQVIRTVTTATISRVRAWIDRFGVLQVYGTSGFDGIAATFTDSPALSTAARYVDVQRGFDSEDCINTVYVEVSNGAETVTNGPWVNFASVAAWGTRAATYKTYDANSPLSPTAGAGLASTVLDSNASPAMKVQSITTYNSTPTIRAAAIAAAPQRRVSVIHRDTTYSCRVLQVTHRITARAGDLRRPATWHTDFVLGSATAVPLPLN